MGVSWSGFVDTPLQTKVMAKAAGPHWKSDWGKKGTEGMRYCLGVSVDGLSHCRVMLAAQPQKKRIITRHSNKLIPDVGLGLLVDGLFNKREYTGISKQVRGQQHQKYQNG